MTPVQLNQRCWNHEEREAACRCPACGRSYCRECVSEHDGRLLCAACLSALSAQRVEETGGLRRLAPAAMIAAGILLAWLIYWAAGVGLIGFLHRLENTGATVIKWGGPPGPRGFPWTRSSPGKISFMRVPKSRPGGLPRTRGPAPLLAPVVPRSGTPRTGDRIAGATRERTFHA